MVGMAMSMSLTSCNDDDDEIYHTDTTQYTAGVMYSINLSDTWYTFFDITATYTDLAGKTHTETITANKDIKLLDSFSTISKSYSFNMVAKPKATAPSFDSNATYKFTDNSAMYAYKYVATSTSTTPGAIFKNESTESLTVNDMAGFIADTQQLFTESYVFAAN